MAEVQGDWSRYRWSDPGLDWRQARIISAGVDVGSVSSQALVMSDGRPFCYASIRTGASSPDSAVQAMELALEGTGLELPEVHFTVGTGYGRVKVPFAGRAIAETACHARGANFIYGERVRTVLDMGGQDCKVIRCDSRGKVTNFIMNDKCAAGTGRGLEVFARLLQVPVPELGPLSLRVEQEPPPVSDTCVVFARNQALELLRGGEAPERVAAAYCRAAARRVVELLERLGVEEALALTGGIAKNPGVVERIQEELGIRFLEPDFDPQLAGALGAALFAKALVEKKRRKARHD